MLIQPSCGAWRAPASLTLGVLAFVVAPVTLQLLYHSPVTYEATVRPRTFVSEPWHSTERQPGQDAVRATQTSASTTSRTPLQGTTIGGPAVLTGQLTFVRGA